MLMLMRSLQARPRRPRRTPAQQQHSSIKQLCEALKKEKYTARFMINFNDVQSA